MHPFIIGLHAARVRIRVPKENEKSRVPELIQLVAVVARAVLRRVEPVRAVGPNLPDLKHHEWEVRDVGPRL